MCGQKSAICLANPCTAVPSFKYFKLYICSAVCLIMVSDLSTFSVALYISHDWASLLNVRRHQLENEKHLCSAVSRKSGKTLKGTGMCGKKTLVKCMVPH